MRKINEIILHCSATPDGKDFTIKDIDTWHKQRGFNEIGYHYVIYRDGTIHKGRAIEKIGAHCLNHNSNSIGICYIGGCTKDNKSPKDTRTDEQRFSLFKLVCHLCDKYKITDKDVRGHYEFANKACPSFDIKQFQKELFDFRCNYPLNFNDIKIYDN